VFSSYRTKPCAVDAEVGYAKKIIVKQRRNFTCFAKKMASAMLPVIDIQFFRKITLLIIYSSIPEVGIFLECLNSGMRKNM
jgi:hypothetical protein